MRMFVFICITLATFLGANLAVNGANLVDDTGNQLIQTCNHKNYDEENILWAWCAGYVVGVDKGFGMGARTAFSEAFRQYTRKQIQTLGKYVLDYCPPENLTKEQMALVVSKYLEEHPESLNQDGASLVIDAFRTAWPCEVKAHTK